MRRLALWLVWVGLCLSAPAAAQTAPELVGGDTQLWLVVSEAGELTLLMRDAGRWVPQGSLSGTLAGAAAARGQLHLFLREGWHQLYHPRQGLYPGRWPTAWRQAELLAASAGPAPGATGRSVFVLLILNEPATLPATAAAPADAPDDAPDDAPAPATTAPAEAPPVTLAAEPSRRAVLYVYHHPEWRRLAELPVEPPAGGSAELVVPAAGPAVLLRGSAGQVLGLYRYAEGQWLSLDVPELGPGSLAQWLLAPKGTLTLAGTSRTEAGRQVWLRRLGPDGWTEPSLLAQRDQPLTLEPQAPVALAEVSDTIALAWQGADQWLFATVGPQDRLNLVTPIDALGTEAQPPPWLENRGWILLVLVALLMGLWVLRQRQMGGRPFLLPPRQRPASWAKRILAFLLDVTPFVLLVSWAMDLPEVDTQALLAVWRDNRWPGGDATRWLLANLLSLGGYVVYAIVAETLFGATLAKRLLGMRVVGDGGGRPELLAVVVRNLSKLMEVQPVLIIVFLVWPMLTRYRQRFGDVIARTAVIDRAERTEATLVEGFNADRMDKPAGPPAPPPPPHQRPEVPPGPEDRSDEDASV